MIDHSVLLSTAYFAPIQYYAHILYHDKIFVEKYENFIKQTYRNRAVILGGNGLIPLIVPVQKGRGTKILIKDLKISYAENWQHTHWQSIYSAYNSSPYFEYYKDEIIPIFQTKFTFLLDLNVQIYEILAEAIGIDKALNFTSDFEQVDESTLNLREGISPKIDYRQDKLFKVIEYTQVFSEHIDFQPNLSILDLLFNEGPNTSFILQESINKSNQ